MNAAARVYVINLDRSPERMSATAGALDKSGFKFSRVQAVDGSHEGLGAARYDAGANARAYLAPLTDGEAGCLHSHRKAWRNFLEDGATVGIFLEDDARPLAPATAAVDFSRSVCSGELPILCQLNTALTRSRGRPRACRPLVPPLTTAAYAANRGAAEKLLAFTDQFHEPIDIALQRWWDHRIRILVAIPPLFYEEDASIHASTIRSPGSVPPEGRLLRELRRPMFRAHRFARALLETLVRGRP